MPKNYLPQQNTINQYIADGITSIFNYKYLILLDEDIAVYVTNPGETPNPDKDLQILNQDYTVQNAGNETGGTITFVKNKIPIANSIVTLIRSMQVSIDTEFGNAQTFNGLTLDAAFERVLLIMQQFQTQLGTRALQYIINSYLDSNLSNILPVLTTKDNQVWVSLNGTIIAAQIENTDVSTLRSELASQAPNGGDGTGLIGYYDVLNKQGKTLQNFLNQLQTYIEHIKDFLPIPDPDGLSEGLPVYYRNGSLFIYEGDVGKIFATVYPNPSFGELLCDGTSYLRTEFTHEIIPNIRLANKLWNEEIGYYQFGTGSSFVSVNLNNQNQLILTTNQSGEVKASSAETSGFTLEEIFKGDNVFETNAFLSTDIPNRVYVQGKKIGVVAPPAAETSGFNIFKLRISDDIKQLFYIECTDAKNLAGKWFQFSNITKAFGVYFTVDGQGTNPVPPNLTAVLLPLLSTQTAQEVATYLAELLGGHQLTLITCKAATTIKPGDYWTFSTNAQTFNVYARINGQGEPPPAPGMNIPVDLINTDTVQEVAKKIKIAINQFYFAVPDLQDAFIRGWNKDASVKVDDRYLSYGQGLIKKSIGSFQLDEISSHIHNIYGLNTEGSGSAVSTPYANPYISDILILPTGGAESRPINFATNFVIKC